MTKQYNTTFENVIFFLERNYHFDFELLDWNAISSYRYLSDNFIRKYKNFLNWNNICTTQNLSANMILEHSKYINFNIVSNKDSMFKNKVFNTNGEKTMKNTIDLKCINRYALKNFEILIEFMEMNTPDDFNLLDWVSISRMRHLSEDFISKYKSKVHWGEICTHQNLSEFFIRRHIKYINPNALTTSQLKNLSYDFVVENKDSGVLNTELLPKEKIIKRITENKKNSISYYHKLFFVENKIRKRTGIIDDTLITLTLASLKY
ncbi:MAG TPA: hypothetical protein V6C58_14055 [Allocoleopsis sp.]